MDANPQATPTEESSPAWYVVQVKRYEEQRVVRYLTMKSIPTFLPLIESVRRRAGIHGLDRLEPLFSGYLFVRMQAIDVNSSLWNLLRWTPGVQRILGTEGMPVPMPTDVIEAIQARIRELGFVRPGIRYTMGARVRIRSGPLAGLAGIFDRPMSRRGRVRVLLELLGQLRRAEVDELDLESA